MGEGHAKLATMPVPHFGLAQIKGTAHSTAWSLFAGRAPDPVAHMGVGGVGNTGLAQVADMLLVFFDLGIAARQVERDRIDVVYIGIAKTVDLKASGLEHFATAGVIFVTRFLGIGPQHGMADAQHARKFQVLGSRFGRHLGGDFNARGYFVQWVVHKASWVRINLHNNYTYPL